MKDQPTFEPGYDYEPEYDLHAAFEQNRHAYWNFPKFRAMLDNLPGADPQRNADYYSLSRPKPYPEEGQ